LEKVKTCAVTSGRIARRGEVYILYNTRNFSGIYLDDTAYKLWNYININTIKGIEVGTLIEYMINKGEGQCESNEKLIRDSHNLIDFLQQNGFIVRETYEKAE
jgi:hypothetical protein